MAFVLEEEETVAPSKDFMAQFEEETTPQKIGRGVARSGARSLETLLGVPGDVQELLLSLVGEGAKKLGVPEETVETAKKFSKDFGMFPGLKTSTEIREKITEPLTGEYLKPKTKGEELSDDIVQDATSLLIPTKSPKGLKVGKHILRAFGTAAGANLASELAGGLGAEETGKTAAKLGSMMLLGSIGKDSPKKYINNLYSQAEEAIKGAPKIDAKELGKNLKTLEKSLKSGLGAPSEKAVLSKLEELQKKIKKGQIGVDELWASKRSINEEMTKALFDTPSKAAKARAKNLFKQVNRDLNKELAKYGQQNKTFGNAFKNAEEGYAALQQSQLLGNFIKKNAKYTPLSPLLYPLVQAVPSPTAAGALGGAAAYKTGQIGYRLAKSPTLRKYYSQVLKEASRENAVGMNRALVKLDEELMKTEKTAEGRFILED
jgi:hypothetical protein